MWFMVVDGRFLKEFGGTLSVPANICIATDSERRTQELCDLYMRENPGIPIPVFVNPDTVFDFRESVRNKG